MTFKLILSVCLLLFAVQNTFSQSHCDFVKSVQHYQEMVNRNKTVKKEGDSLYFNPVSYMKYFTGLSLPDGKKLFEYYSDGFLGAVPVLYLADSGFDLEKYISDQIPRRLVKKSYRQERLEYSIRYGFLRDSSNRARYNMIPEDTESGYFQYLFFYILGEQFDLFWHAKYDERLLLCNPEDVMEFAEEYWKSARFTVDTDQLEIFQQTDPSPVVNLSDEYCIISWTELETHFGVYRRTYRINRQAPWAVMLEKEEKLVNIVPNFLY